MVQSRHAYTCGHCGVSFVSIARESQSGLRFCSKQCWATWRRGDLATRFWSRVNKAEDATGCWLWQGSRRDNGYGQFAWRPRSLSVHRIAWELANGPIPDGFMVLHRCDVRHCVRNDGVNSHLFLGTPRDNTADMYDKGRDRRAQPLSQDTITAIRAAYAAGDKLATIAKVFNIGRGTAAHAAKGEYLGPSRKLTVTQVRAIRDKYAAGGTTQPELAAEFGIRQSTVWAVIRHRTWRHLD
jgi:hypothetical protein